MWRWTTLGGQDVCLIPEGTAIIQSLWNDGWSKSMRKPARLFYVSRCYRFDRPQRGRYREFTQFGVEILGNKDGDREEAISLLGECLKAVGVDYRLVDQVQRGIGYYVDDGFEAECDALGAQKQIAGGGRYPEGIGWAIGVDRVMLAQS